MAIANNEITVGETRYVVSTLAAEKGLPLLGKLSRFLGGSIGAALKAGLDDLEGAAMGAALAELGQHLASDDFLALVYGLLEGVTVLEEGKGAQALVAGKSRVLFNRCFTGDYGALARVAFEALRVNFGGFFSAFPELAGLLEQAKGKAKEAAATSLNRRLAKTGESPSS